MLHVLLKSEDKERVGLHERAWRVVRVMSVAKDVGMEIAEEMGGCLWGLLEKGEPGEEWNGELRGLFGKVRSVGAGGG
jgi:hypothetical protein